MAAIKTSHWIWKASPQAGESISGPVVALLLALGAILLSLILVLLKVEDSLWWGSALAVLFFLLVIRFIVVWDKTINLLWPWKVFLLLSLGAFYFWLVGKQVLARYREQHAVTVNLQVKYDQIQHTTLHDRFKNDFGNTLKLGNTFVIENKIDKHRTSVEAQLYLNDLEHSEFVGYYIPSTAEIASRDRTRGIVETIVKLYPQVLKWGNNGIYASSMETAQDITTQQLTPTGRVYVYHEDDLTAQDIAKYAKIYKDAGQEVIFRGTEYRTAQMYFELSKANLGTSRPQ